MDETTIADPVARYLELKADKDRRVDELKPINAEMKQLEEVLASQFLGLGKTSETRNGMTVYISRQLKAEVTDALKLADALRATSNEQMLTINSSSLKSWLREMLYDEKLGEWVADESRLPAEFQECLRVTEFSRVAARKK